MDNKQIAIFCISLLFENCASSDLWSCTITDGSWLSLILYCNHHHSDSVNYNRSDDNTCDYNYMICFQKYTQKNQTMFVVLSLAYAIFTFPLFPVELGVQVGVYPQSIQFSRMTTFADRCVLVPGVLFLVLVDVRRQCLHLHDHRPRVSGRVPAISQGCHWLFKQLTGGLLSVACKLLSEYWI